MCVVVGGVFGICVGLCVVDGGLEVGELGFDDGD